MRYMIQETDLNKRFLKINGETHMLNSSIGYVQKCDIGKIVTVKNGLLSIESDEQRTARESDKGYEVKQPTVRTVA